MADSPLSDDALVRTRAALGSLHPAERRVADFVLGAPEVMASLSITRLADRCDTSEATISRFVRALGFEGYKDYRLAVTRATAFAEAAHGSAAPSGDIEADEPLSAIIEKLSYSDRAAVDETAKSVDLAQFATARDAIVAARRIVVFGVGASELVASDLAQKLQRIDLSAWSFLDADRAAGAASLLGDRDVSIVISASGETAAAVGVQREAVRSRATAIAITSNPRSALALEATIALISASRETTYRSGATSSRIAQLFMVDCLFVATASKTHGSSTAALETTRAAVSRLRTR